LDAITCHWLLKPKGGREQGVERIGDGLHGFVDLAIVGAFRNAQSLRPPDNGDVGVRRNELGIENALDFLCLLVNRLLEQLLQQLSIDQRIL
jgi:hypothetical protein